MSVFLAVVAGWLFGGAIWTLLGIANQKDATPLDRVLMTLYFLCQVMLGLTAAVYWTKA